jgi:hypothetical protein
MSDMKKQILALPSRSAHRLATTVGELISAAFEAAPGNGSARLAVARAILTSRPLARRLSRPIALVATGRGD